MFSLSLAGIGSGVNKAELEQIASDANHTVEVANFDALRSLTEELTYVACKSRSHSKYGLSV